MSEIFKRYYKIITYIRHKIIVYIIILGCLLINVSSTKLLLTLDLGETQVPLSPFNSKFTFFKMLTYVLKLFWLVYTLCSILRIIILPI